MKAWIAVLSLALLARPTPALAYMTDTEFGHTFDRIIAGAPEKCLESNFYDYEKVIELCVAGVKQLTEEVGRTPTDAGTRAVYDLAVGMMMMPLIRAWEKTGVIGHKGYCENMKLNQKLFNGIDLNAIGYAAGEMVTKLKAEHRKRYKSDCDD